MCLGTIAFAQSQAQHNPTDTTAEEQPKPANAKNISDSSKPTSTLKQPSSSSNVKKQNEHQKGIKNVKNYVKTTESEAIKGKKGVKSSLDTLVFKMIFRKTSNDNDKFLIIKNIIDLKYKNIIIDSLHRFDTLSVVPAIQNESKPDSNLTSNVKTKNNSFLNIFKPIIDDYPIPVFALGALLLFLLTTSFLYFKSLTSERKSKVHNNNNPVILSIKKEESLITESAIIKTELIGEKEKSIAGTEANENTDSDINPPLPDQKDSLEDISKIESSVVSPVAPISLQGSIHYFVSEILMTAGPRKKMNVDNDLGEDVCGMVARHDEVLMWLLDGTSDLHCLKSYADNKEYFSSRLLAQSIASALKRHFHENTLILSADLVNNCIQEVKANWVMELNNLPDEEKEMLVRNINEKNLPECACTILIAHLSLSGMLTCYRSGDSKMLLFSGAGGELPLSLNATLAGKNENSNDRIFFRIILNDDDMLDIQHNMPLNELVTETDIQALIAFSDGIGSATEQVLMKDYGGYPEKAREEVVHIFQGTADDKSICFIQVK